MASLLVAAAAILGLLWRANELGVLSFAEIEKGEEVLWGSANQGMGFKWLALERARPDILVVGSSRATQFRSGMFPGLSFYNASFMATSLPDVESFFEKLLRTYVPKVVMLVIDPWWFNPERGLTMTEKVNLEDQGQRWRLLVSNFLRVASDGETMATLWAGTDWRQADPLGGRRPIGYRATYLAFGFRPDGSLQYGNILLNLSPFFTQAGFGYASGFAYHRRQVRELLGRFSYVGEPGAEQIIRIERILTHLRTAGSRVVVLLPPFASAVYAEIQKTPAQQRYFETVEALVEKIARSHGAEFYNYHDLAILGVDDVQTIDGLHIDEIASAALVLDLFKKSSALGALVAIEDRVTLADRLADRNRWTNPHLLFR